MTLTINTNMGSLIVQNNLNNATNALNQSIERMTTGYKINTAGDDAAGYSVATGMETDLSSTSVAQNNVALGSSLLSVAESNYDIMITHMQRIRDLTEQAANGTYGDDSIEAINAEITARFAEIDRISENAEYNGIKLLNGSIGADGINLQVGIGSDGNSRITLEQTLFEDADTQGLIGVNATTYTGYITTGTTATITQALDAIDDGLAKVTSRQTEIGAVQNRLDSAAEALTVQFDNLTSSLSTVKDTDIAAES